MTRARDSGSYQILLGMANLAAGRAATGLDGE